MLLIDHELAASTLAARVAASVRADPYAVVGTGLGPVSGVLHGGASRLARAVLDARMPGLTAHADFATFKAMTLPELAKVAGDQITPAQLDAVAADLAVR